MTISLIVPFYNCEKYVDDCLNSVLAQTETDWECICVNDCSTDKTGVILDAYAAKDNRIKVIHTAQNLGNAARSRNVGLQHISGEFVAFCDGDDAFVPTALEQLLSAITETNSDLAKGDAVSSPEALNNAGGSPINNRQIWRGDFLISLWQKKKGFPRANVVNCLFRRAIWPDMRFNEALYHDEDYMFMQQFLCRAKQIVTVSTPVYFYRIHPDSLTAVLQPDIYISSILERLNEDARVLLPLVADNPELKCALLRKDTQDFYRRLIRKIVRKTKSKDVAFAQLDLVRPAWVSLEKAGIVDKRYLTPYQRGVLAWFNRGYYKTLWRVLRLIG